MAETIIINEYGMKEYDDGTIKIVHPVLFINKFVEETKEIYVLNGKNDEILKYNKNLGIYEVKRESAIQHALFKYAQSLYPLKWVPSWEKSYFTTFKRSIKIVSEFDRHPNKIVMANGIYDTDTHQLSPFSPKHYATRCIPVKFDTSATCPRFLEYLDQVSLGSDAMIETLKQLLGYCCTTSVAAEKIFFLLGNGANGKSVFSWIISQIVGIDNIASFDFKSLDSRFNAHALCGKNVDIITEASFKNAECIIPSQAKAYCSGDLITAEIKLGPTYQFFSTIKFILLSNELPEGLHNVQDAELRRMLFIPFQAKFDSATADKNLKTKLKKELSGIFNVAMSALKKLVADNYQFPYEEQSKELIDAYIREKIPILSFVNSSVRVAQGARILNKDAFAEYRKWCSKKNINQQYTQDLFSKEFKKCLLEKMYPIDGFKSNGERGLKNITII